jgi:hypothetical protein
MGRVHPDYVNDEFNYNNYNSPAYSLAELLPAWIIPPIVVVLAFLVAMAYCCVGVAPRSGEFDSPLSSSCCCSRSSLTKLKRTSLTVSMFAVCTMGLGWTIWWAAPLVYGSGCIMLYLSLSVYSHITTPEFHVSKLVAQVSCLVN